VGAEIIRRRVPRRARILGDLASLDSDCIQRTEAFRGSG